MMREVDSTEAQVLLEQLLDEVELGEAIVITRHGRPIARLISEADRRRGDILATMERLAAFRTAVQPILIDEILAARHEGRHR